ncbi:CynX/NimT family MFS transporter [Murinocardiopsis flavida]|nr:MFS transporter [Murinocardiopsis flavida]
MPNPPGSSRSQHHGPPRRRNVAWLLVAGVGLAAINLRTAITSIGPVLGEVTAGLGMSSAVAGVLTTLPVLCFAVFGALTPAMIRRFGEHHLLVGAIGALALGLAARALMTDQWLFLLFSAVALSGGAVGNVLLPTLIKQHFPERVGAMTTLYTTGLALGTTGAAAGTVPLAQAAGGWHIAIGAYALVAVLGVLPWVFVLRDEPPARADRKALGTGTVLRTAMGWQSVVFFGSQATIAYVLFGWFAELLRDNGLSAGSAGLVLSYLTALSIPTSLALPALMARVRDHRLFIVLFYACYVAGFTGLWLAPIGGVWIWATLIGLGMSTFPLALTFFAVRTRTAAGTAAMSASSQSIGYLMAGLGPFLFGLLHELTGGWQVPIAMMLGIATLNLAAGMLLGRDRYLEDAAAPAGADRGGVAA